MDQKHHCQVLWAKNKYLVLSHSSNIYKEIREYLKQDQVEVSHVEALIQQALALPENRGQVSNAFQHIWGYFKKQATPEEKENFMLLLEKYQHGQASQEDLIKGSRRSLSAIPIATCKSRHY
ncbi:type II DNA modification enzyme-like protein [Streptococcus sp. ZB199]|nr:type II DNA modification enzyme-like protein [Streptococcus sp. ZB199]